MLSKHSKEDKKIINEVFDNLLVSDVKTPREKFLDSLTVTLTGTCNSWVLQATTSAKEFALFNLSFTRDTYDISHFSLEEMRSEKIVENFLRRLLEEYDRRHINEVVWPRHEKP